MEAHFATVWEAIADEQPQDLAIVHGDHELDWQAYDDRSSRLAAALLAADIGRDATVALYLRNCPAYAEATFAAAKVRAVPVNVNYRYLDDELLEILADSEAEAVVYHAGLADRVDRVAPRARHVKLWIEVTDSAGPDAGSTSGNTGVRLEDLIDGHAPAGRTARSGDDRWLLYTGGTTGRPRGVVYRVGTLVSKFLAQLPPMLGLDPATGPSGALDIARRLRAEDRRYVALPACPLMHGVGQWRGVLMPHLLGGTSVLLTSRSLDPGEVFSEASRRGVVSMAVVGDPVVRPLVRELELLARAGNTPDLSRLKLLFSSGATLSRQAKAALHELIDDLTVVDAFGASEASFGSQITTRAWIPETGRFSLSPTARVLAPDGKPMPAGSGGCGLVAVSGDIPLGYHRDPDKTAAVFRVIDGTRYAIPGDWVQLGEDGSAIFLGRDSSCINSGGEKIFPEEIEEVLKGHPDIEDSLVVGVPDDRFGNRPAAVATAVPGSTPDEQDLLDYIRQRLATYKVPVGVVLVRKMPRHDNGKPDHAAAARLWELNGGTWSHEAQME